MGGRKLSRPPLSSSAPMNEALRTLAAQAANQHGVVAARQAQVAGVSRWALGRHVASGTLIPVGPHSFHFAGSPLSWRGRLMAGRFGFRGVAPVAARRTGGPPPRPVGA